MVQIYRISWRCIVENVWFYLFCALAIELSLFIVGEEHSTTITLIPLLIFAYVIHRYFLYGESIRFGTRQNSTRPYKFGRFILMSLLVMGAPIAIGVLVSLTIVPDTWVGTREGLTLTLILVTLPLYLLFLSFFGTALPAAVARDESGYALSKGYRLGLGIMGRLLLGPGLVGTILISAGIVALVATSGVQLPPNMQSVANFVAVVIFRLIGMVGTTFAVAVLCDAYRKIVPLVSAPFASHRRNFNKRWLKPNRGFGPNKGLAMQSIDFNRMPRLPTKGTAGPLSDARVNLGNPRHCRQPV